MRLLAVVIEDREDLHRPAVGFERVRGHGGELRGLSRGDALRVADPHEPAGDDTDPGIWSAGNANRPMTMVVSAAAAGVMAGAGVHGELAMTDLARAVDGGSARQ